MYFYTCTVVLVTDDVAIRVISLNGSVYHRKSTNDFATAINISHVKYCCGKIKCISELFKMADYV